MAARRRQSRPTHRWFQVRARVRCSLGDHDAAAGVWMRTRIGDFRGLSSCETCLAPQGIYRPNRKFVFRREGVEDVKGRQVGND